MEVASVAVVVPAPDVVRAADIAASGVASLDVAVVVVPAVVTVVAVAVRRTLDWKKLFPAFF